MDKVEALGNILGLLERADDLLREAQLSAEKGLGKDHWVYRELWTLWQIIGWEIRRLQELKALLIEEQALKEQ